MNKPKVIIAYHFFAHYRTTIIEQLARNERFDFVFAGDLKDPGDGTIRSYQPSAAVEFIQMKCRRFGVLMWQPSVVKLPFQRDVEAVVFLGNMYMIWTWVAVLLCRLRGQRVLFWSHGWRRKERGLKNLIRKLFYRLANGLLVYEHNAKCIAIQEGFAADRVHVVYNSLDTVAQEQAAASVEAEELNNLKAQYFGNSDPVVLCSSRLVPLRRIDLLIEAVTLLKQSGHSVNLLVIGDGPQKDELMSLAESNQISAKFVGACYDERQLAYLFGMSCATVSPGPIGLMTIHSFAYGVPVIVSDDMGVQGPEWGTIIAGENGDHFVHGDAESLADTIRRWTQSCNVDPGVASACRSVVTDAYNSVYQSSVIERAVAGCAADDLLRTRR